MQVYPPLFGPPLEQGGVHFRRGGTLPPDRLSGGSWQIIPILTHYVMLHSPLQSGMLVNVSQWSNSLGEPSDAFHIGSSYRKSARGCLQQAICLKIFGACGAEIKASPEEVYPPLFGTPLEQGGYTSDGGGTLAWIRTDYFFETDGWCIIWKQRSSPFQWYNNH